MGQGFTQFETGKSLHFICLYNMMLEENGMNDTSLFPILFQKMNIKYFGQGSIIKCFCQDEKVLSTCLWFLFVFLSVVSPECCSMPGGIGYVLYKVNNKCLSVANLLKP